MCYFSFCFLVLVSSCFPLSYLLSDLPSPMLEDQSRHGCVAVASLAGCTSKRMKEADACLGSWGCTRHCILMKQNFMLLLQLDKNTKASLGFCGRTWQMLQCKGQQNLHALHSVPWQVQPLFSCTAKAKIGVNVLFSAMAGYSYGKWEIPAWGLKGRAHSEYF